MDLSQGGKARSRAGYETSLKENLRLGQIKTTDSTTQNLNVRAVRFFLSRAVRFFFYFFLSYCFFLCCAVRLFFICPSLRVSSMMDPSQVLTV